jgi:hypothetical protein
MLEIDVPEMDYWNDVTDTGIHCPSMHLRFEHSLLSISKWESKWEKPFLVDTPEKTEEELIDYFDCMCLEHIDENLKQLVYSQYATQIFEWMNSTQSAARIYNMKVSNHRSVITSEDIYYWMIVNHIPFEPCEHWHLNRLLKLIEFCSVKNSPPRKMSNSEIYAQNRRLNEQRRAQNKSKG